MAELLNQKTEQEMDFFNRMGKPLGEKARAAAYETCKLFGLSSARAWECVGQMANALERDEPYAAMTAGTRFIDLTGTYRLMATLLAEGE